MKRVVSLFLSSLLMPLLLGTSLAAQSRQEVDKKIDAVKHQIHELVQQTEHWEKKGYETRAASLRKKADGMERELHAWLRKMEKARARRQEKQEPRRILEGLLAGARSLRQLGRIEQAEQLEEIAKNFARKLERQGVDQDERAIVKRHLRNMRFAVEILVAADKHKAADRVEHFMHAIELGMEGHKDEKAQRIRKTAPKPQQILGDLETAVVILRREDQKEKAAAVLETLRHIAQRVKSKADRGDHDEDDEGDEADEDHKAGEDDEDESEDEDEDDDDEAEERIEKLEERIQKIERYLKELGRALKKRR